MVVVERKRGKSFKGLNILLIIVGIFLAANSLNILSSYSKFTVHKTKEVSTITKSLTASELLDNLDSQHKLSREFVDKKTQYWLYLEIADGKDSILFNDYTFMLDHPEFDSAKIQFTVFKYKVNGKTIEFANKSKIIQVHSKKGWEDIKN
jgi:hypothetical protein